MQQDSENKKPFNFVRYTFSNFVISITFFSIFFYLRNKTLNGVLIAYVKDPYLIIFWVGYFILNLLIYMVKKYVFNKNRK